MSKPIALILLNWNTKKHTEQCINSLLKYADNLLFDIIVADNGSSDNSLEYLKAKFPEVVYLDNKENLGFAGGNNRALNLSRRTGYKFSMLLNTDTLIENDVISQLYNFLVINNEAAAVQPAIYYTHQKNKLWNGELKFNSFFGFTYSKKKLPIFPKEVDWITGCCFLIRNEVLIETGDFNSKYFLYYEDVELSFRMREKGYHLYLLPTEKIFHEAGVSAQLEAKEKEGTLNPIIHYYLVRNRIWFIRKYGNKAFLIFNVLFIGSYLMCVLAYFILKSKKKKRAFLIQGIKDGCFTNTKFIYS